MANQMKAHPRIGLKDILTSGWSDFRFLNHRPSSVYLIGSFVINFSYSQQKIPPPVKDESGVPETPNDEPLPGAPVTPNDDTLPGVPVTPKEVEDGKKVKSMYYK